MKLALAFVVLNFLISPWALAQRTCEDIFRNDLSAPAKAALLAADRNGYKVLVLRGDLGGETKTIVLMGETHYKDKKDSETGKNVLKEFTFRGLEGFDPAPYWFSSFLRLVSDGVFAKMKSLFSDDKISEGSTIHDAADQGKRSGEFEMMRARLRDVMEHKLSTGRISKERFIEKAKSFIWTLPNGKQVSMADLLGEESVQKFAKLLEIKPEDIPRAQVVNPILNVQLELGKSKPNWKDNLTMLHFMTSLGSLFNLKKVAPVVTASCSAAACFGAFGDLGPISGAAIGLGASVGYGLSSRLTMDAMGKNRDRIMVENLVEALKVHHGQDTILVIVGENHVPGMRNRLEENFGFQTEYFALRPFVLPSAASNGADAN
ncbi:hypothetical protein [Bdellovibrio sp. HCB2-146]|uniref:hypothetical protein n=1 Tax=Bdellovibrio sp. HCB2-146 TaxID=3394362 RepID=UPI0039BCA9DB